MGFGKVNVTPNLAWGQHLNENLLVILKASALKCLADPSCCASARHGFGDLREWQPCGQIVLGMYMYCCHLPRFILLLLLRGVN